MMCPQLMLSSEEDVSSLLNLRGKHRRRHSSVLMEICILLEYTEQRENCKHQEEHAACDAHHLL